MSTKKKRPTRICWQCGANGNGDPLEQHHVYGGANRANSDRYGATVYLCRNKCHQMGPQAVHNNRENDLRLKGIVQKMVMRRQGWDTERFRAVFGKSWIPEVTHEP